MITGMILGYFFDILVVGFCVPPIVEWTKTFPYVGKYVDNTITRAVAILIGLMLAGILSIISPGKESFFQIAIVGIGAGALAVGYTDWLKKTLAKIVLAIRGLIK